jgi:hypothetical protein
MKIESEGVGKRICGGNSENLPPRAFRRAGVSCARLEKGR